MERGKNTNSGKGSKKMGSHLGGGEYFVLGVKGGRDDSKSKLMSTSESRKREASGAGSSTAIKKAKLSNPSTPPNEATTSGSGGAEQMSDLWEHMATECEVVELVRSIHDAWEQQDNDSIVRLICGAIKNITSFARVRVDSLLYLTIQYIAKIQPQYFCNDIVTQAMVSVLRREAAIKGRQTQMFHVIIVNLLARGYMAKEQWPQTLLRIYVEDATNERLIADNADCAAFNENICAAFCTRLPPQNLLQLEAWTPAGVNAPTAQTLVREISNTDDDSSDFLMPGLDSARKAETEQTQRQYSVFNRFADYDMVVEKYVTDVIRDQLNKRQQQDGYTRNLLKFLCTTAGIMEVRHMSIGRLELWIHNAKLAKLAQQLLAFICFNVSNKFGKDHEVLAVIVKMRLKTKPLINFYINCLKDMITLQPEILPIMLKLVVQNELSNTRNPNNMGMLAAMFQAAPDQSACHLAEIYKEFLLQRDDCLRTLRVFLRELVRILRFEINLEKFCKDFLYGRRDLTEQIERSEFRDRIFYNMVDLTCVCMLLTVSPQVREACAALRQNRDMSGNANLKKFFEQISQMQIHAVAWMYEIVPGLFKVQNAEYMQALNKLLLLEAPEQYSRCEQWPAEAERASLLRMVAETPIKQEALLHIILIGITKDIPVNFPETFDILMHVIKRASALRVASISSVQVERVDVIDFLFTMAEYHHPGTIKLPADYTPPKLAISVLYWKAWVIMLMLASHNPETFGSFCWQNYATMRMLMEMCITSQYTENFTKDEEQIQTLERDQIIEFETYLAAQTSHAVITEDTAILLSQVMLMDPMGAARRLPQVVLDQVIFLNKTYKLGHLLCRCRKPDLLLDIIHRQGATQSMPWLSDLVQNNEGDFNHLPAQCLCEFLLFNANTINEQNERDAELLSFLRALITSADADKTTACEILDYIFRRLASTVKQQRLSALKGLEIIFNDPNWLLQQVPKVPHFAEARAFIIPQLRAACQVENTPQLVMLYIQFIAAHTLEDSVVEMFDHTLDMSQLIVERSTMFQHIVPATDHMLQDTTDNDELYQSRLQTLKCLFVMSHNYIIKLREPHEPFECNNYQEFLIVEFADDTQLTLHVNVIHALIILLCHSSNTFSENIYDILNYWFPYDRAPNAYFVNNEPAQLIPDWLKLKMLRSCVDSLINAALRDLTPDQIVLFVQNFGTPVHSMTKLLSMLDHAVLHDYNAVKNAILNKAYLAQLIEIQQNFGAKSGYITVRALGLNSLGQSVPDAPLPRVRRFERIDMTALKKRKANLHKRSMLPAVAATTEHDELLQTLQKCASSSIAKDTRRSQLLKKLQTRFSNSLASTQQRDKHLEKSYACALLRVIIKLDTLSNKDTNLLLKRVEELRKKSTSSSSKLPTAATNMIYINTLQALLKKKVASSAAQESKKFKVCKFDEQMTISAFLKSSGVTHYSDGELLDWLTEIDPEFERINKQLRSVLFSKQCRDFRFHLLSIICHQTNWTTVISTLNHLLYHPYEDFDCNTALNFIQAVVKNPRLWQGRDKSTTKTMQYENSFLQKKLRMEDMASLIMQCAASIETENATELALAPTAGKVVCQNDYKLGMHMSFLFKVTNPNRAKITKLVGCILQSNYAHHIKTKVLQQLYLLHPAIKFIEHFELRHYMGNVQHLKGCAADKLANFLITCLGNLQLKKDFEALSSDTDLLMRKFAASHPALFLRQFGVLSSLLQGRAQLSLRALRDEFHMHRFIQILRTLELLQPLLFNDVYKEELYKVLDCYFAFLSNHSNAKEACHILIKFVELLRAYVNYNASSALTFIEPNVDLLLTLSSRFPNIVVLYQLIQLITFLQQKTASTNDVQQQQQQQEVCSLDTTEPVSLEISEIGYCSTLSIGQQEFESKNKISPHFLNLIKIIKQANTEDAILGPLQEIESYTSKRFAFLSELFDRLLELIFSHSAQIRSNAFILLVRHLKYNPGRADINRAAFNSYIQCLRDDNSSVATTAVDNLVEMTLLLQEYANAILTAAFSLGIRSRVNTAAQIKRVMQTIMLQYGY